MTGAEIVTHVVAFVSGAGPTVGLVLRERAKRHTAEATALSGAVSMAQEAMASAKEAMAKAGACEDEREEEREARAACERRTMALHRELEALRRDLEMSGALKSDPERPTPPEVIEAWSEGFAKRHKGAEQ